MAEKNTNNITWIILAFVGIIIGVILVSTIADMLLDNTQEYTVTKEGLDISSARNIEGGGINDTIQLHVVNAYADGWRTIEKPAECKIDTNFLLYNQTEVLMSSGNYSGLTDNGYFYLYNSADLNASITSNTTYVSYTYCNEKYITSSWARTALGMTPGFIALAILLFVIGVGVMRYDEWFKQ